MSRLGTSCAMKLGYFTAISDDEMRFAKDAGFDGVEARYERAIPPTPEALARDKSTLERHGLEALTVQWAENYCDYADPFAVFKDMMRACDVLGARILTMNAWVPSGLSEHDQYAYYRDLWTRFGEVANDAGIRIGIENCPHGGRNLAATPVNFERMFETVPNRAIGLEFDPSHFVFEFLDYVSAIREFGDRIYVVHAKDTQVHHDRLRRVGVNGDDWWRFRMPGYGDVDWKALFVALSDVEYDGDMIIEHEDPTYPGHEGLRRGAKFLRQFIL